MYDDYRITVSPDTTRLLEDSELSQEIDGHGKGVVLLYSSVPKDRREAPDTIKELLKTDAKSAMNGFIDEAVYHDEEAQNKI